MSKHRTTWEDAQMAGVTCDGVDVGMITRDQRDDEPFVCGRCGAVLTLIWDVRVEEVQDTPPGIPRPKVIPALPSDNDLGWPCGH